MVTASTTSAPKADLPELATQLGRILYKPSDFSTSKETGAKVVTFWLKPFLGISSAYFVGDRKDAKAWRFGLEYLRCDAINELGRHVTELERKEAPVGHGYINAWYEVDGGPLSGCWVKVFSKSVAEPELCSVLPGTPPYWRLQNDVPASRR